MHKVKTAYSLNDSRKFESMEEAEKELNRLTLLVQDTGRFDAYIMSDKTRTMAFQIPEDLFQRIKAHLERETQRTDRKLTQREFVLGLIEEALNEAERLAIEEAGQDNAPKNSAAPEEEDLPPEKP